MQILVPAVPPLTIGCSAAGDESYFLSRSSLSSQNFFIKNRVTGNIVWNGSFSCFNDAIEAATEDGFDFGDCLSA